MLAQLEQRFDYRISIEAIDLDDCERSRASPDGGHARRGGRFHKRPWHRVNALDIQGDAFFSRLEGEWWLGFQGQ